MHHKIQVFECSTELAQPTHEDNGLSEAARAAIVLRRRCRPAGKGLTKGAAGVEGLEFTAVLGRLTLTAGLRPVE